MNIEFIGGPWDGKVREITDLLEHYQVGADVYPVRNVNMCRAALPKEPPLFKVATYRLAQYVSGEYVYVLSQYRQNL